jgi:hypothetical protein
MATGVTLLLVRNKVRDLRPLIAVVVIVAGAVYVLYAVWRSPHRSDLATFGAFAVAVVALVAPLITWGRRVRAKGAGPVEPRHEYDQLADLLAEAVSEQWTRAANERALVAPEPIPVTWGRPSLPLVGPAAAAVSSQRFTPLPGLSSIGERQLNAGQIGDLHAIYGGLGSGRLVVVGAPGSGKSGAAVLLVLAALKHRKQIAAADRPTVPVPVLFTAQDWDPNEQRVEDWLALQMQQTYPLFVGKARVANATALERVS